MNRRVLRESPPGGGVMLAIIIALSNFLFTSCSTDPASFNESSQDERKTLNVEEDGAIAGAGTGGENGEQTTQHVQEDLLSGPGDDESATDADATKDPGNGTDDDGMGNGKDPGSVDETVEQALVDCNKARMNKTLKKFSQPILFPEVRECAWEKDGNLSRLNGKIRARMEQYVAVKFPKFSRLCSMSFDFPESQPMQFDDEIFLLFGKYVIGSSQNYGVSDAYPTGLAMDKDGYQTFAWTGENALVNQYYEHGVTKKYCLPNTSCDMPLTEMDGNMMVDIPNSEAIRLGVKSGIQFNRQATNQSVKIGFATIGDNDNGDCRHLDFRMTVAFEYVE